MLMSLPVSAEGPASGARRPQAGDVRIEARRAKTWRAFGQGLVYESRPPKGARMGKELGVDLFVVSDNRGGNLCPALGTVLIITPLGNENLTIFVNGINTWSFMV